MKKLGLFGVLLLAMVPRCFADAAPKSFLVVALEPRERLDTVLLQIWDDSLNTFRNKTEADHGPPWFWGAVGGKDIGIMPGGRLRLAVVVDADTLYTPELKGNGHKTFLRFAITDQGLEDRSPYTNTYWSDYLKALLITIVVEVLVALFFFWRWRIERRQLKWIVLVNLITHPTLWSVLFGLGDHSNWTLYAEVIVVVIEALLLIRFVKPLRYRSDMVLLSLLMNTASFVLGNFLYLLSMSL